MSIPESLIWIILDLVLLYKGFSSIFNTNAEYKKNLKNVERFWSIFYKVPILSYLAKQNVNSIKHAGVWYIRFWGLVAILISLIILYQIIMAPPFR